MSILDDWLGEVSKADFCEQHFHKLPYTAAGRVAASDRWCNWQTLERIIAAEDIDLMVCRRGRQYAGPPPTTAEAARRLRDEGYTLLVRHAERHDPQLQQLAESFAADFGGQINVHIYATPGDEFGFGWHYDAEDVFILQTEGSKEYSLRKNSVHPWPLVETIPADMQYEREIMPLFRCRLKAGDWLYIPAGYWHMGQAQQTGVSLAIGVLSPAAIDIYDLARRRLVHSLLWRQRLQTSGVAAGLDRAERRRRIRELLDMLARDLSELYRSEEFVDAVLEEIG